MPTRTPNILFFFPDQHRYDWLGCMGKIPVRTPNLDALAARGVLFTNAVTPSPLCAPARACLAAGREYDRCGVASNQVDYPLDQPTFYQALRDQAGYRTGGVGKFDLHKASYIWGLDGKNRLAEWGFTDGMDNAGKIDAILSGAETPKDPYMAYLHGRGLAAAHVADLRSRRNYTYTHPTPLPSNAYCDNWVGANGLSLLRQWPQDTPWFLQVNFTGPHNPMDITAEMAGWYADVDFPAPQASPSELATARHRPDAAAHNAIRRNYSAMVENIDRWVGLYLAEVERRGELENTLVFFSSDHGDMLGDHARWGKCTPFQQSIGIPLIVAGPDVVHGMVSTVPVSLIDLTSTFLDYAGAKPLADTDSVSLRPLLSGGQPVVHRSCVYSGLGEWRVIYDGRYKLITGWDQESSDPLLFDLVEDPGETIDLAGRHPEHVRRLRTM